MPELRQDEQKLWLILFQIKRVRARLNFLTLQRWLFAVLAILFAVAGLTLLAAARFGPLTFLGFAIFSLIAALAGLLRETRVVRAMHASTLKAAAIADTRGQMKGRLTTVLAFAPILQRSSLWDYLVEDTYGHREEFEPVRIAPRWLSRALYPLLAAILLAALSFPAARLIPAPQRRPASPDAVGTDEITADLSNLEIRPADPALEPNAEIYADPETLRKLADKLAAAQDAERHRRGLSKFLDQARNLANAVQQKLNGIDRAHSNPTRMRLTDRHPGASNKSEQSARKPRNDDRARTNGLADNAPPGPSGPSQPGEAQAPPASPPNSLPPPPADELAAKSHSMQMPPGSDQSPGDPESAANAGDANNGGGSSHGSGSDPGSLYGPASAQPLGSDSFKIAIDAEPSDESSTPGSPTYVPPKVRTPLNSYQYPDQPLARTAVPAADQNTIKRVFER